MNELTQSGNKLVKPSKGFRWNPLKLQVARALAEGVKSQRQIAKEFTVTEKTISIWKRDPEFMARVDEITMKAEHATVAGLLRELYRGIQLKREKVDEDRDTLLDYLKTTHDIAGNSQESQQSSQPIAIQIVMSPSLPNSRNQPEPKIIDLTPQREQKKKGITR